MLVKLYPMLLFLLKTYIDIIIGCENLVGVSWEKVVFSTKEVYTIESRS